MHSSGLVVIAMGPHNLVMASRMLVLEVWENTHLPTLCPGAVPDIASMHNVLLQGAIQAQINTIRFRGRA
eukprot:1489156-Amphidinium_carterae.1